MKVAAGTMTITAGRILQSYYQLRHDYGGPPPPKALRFKKQWDHATAYLTWSEAAGVDPLLFLRYRFEAAKHTGYIPKLHQLRSYQLAEIFKSEWKQDELSLSAAYDRLKAKAGTREQQTVKALRVLTHGHEAAKYPYISTGRWELCLAEINLSGGFHPSSRYCPTCPVAVRCAAELHRTYGFDVVALRAGRLNELPRDVAAAAIR